MRLRSRVRQDSPASIAVADDALLPSDPAVPVATEILPLPGDLELPAPGTNQSVTYTITFKVAAKARGTALIAAATASPKVADPKPLNNAALITVKLG